MSQAHLDLALRLEQLTREQLLEILRIVVAGCPLKYTTCAAAIRDLGFITPDGGGKDAFVHHTAIQADGFRTLEEGERVEMTVVEGTKGPAAEEVVKL